MCLKTRTIKDLQQLEAMRSYWEDCQNHPDIDIDHFKLICCRPEVVSPYVIVVERDGEPCSILAGRIENIGFVLSIGYFKAARIPARIMTLLCNSILGGLDDEI